MNLLRLQLVISILSSLLVGQAENTTHLPQLSRQRSVIHDAESSSYEEEDAFDQPLRSPLLAANLRFGCTTAESTADEKVLKIVVLAQYHESASYSMQKSLPAVLMAVRSERIRQILPGWKVQVLHKDTKCSSIYGPLSAVELYYNKSAGMSCGLVFISFLSVQLVLLWWGGVRYVLIVLGVSYFSGVE